MEWSTLFIFLALVVWRVNNDIHKIYLCLQDSTVCFVNTYQLDSNLSTWCCMSFEQLGHDGLLITFFTTMFLLLGNWKEKLIWSFLCCTSWNYSRIVHLLIYSFARKNRQSHCSIPLARESWKQLLFMTIAWGHFFLRVNDIIFSV